MGIAAQMLDLAVAAQQASRVMANLSSGVKNQLLLNMATALEQAQEHLQNENEKDLERARNSGMAAAMIDRLTLTEDRIKGMADGLREVAALPDPVVKSPVCGCVPMVSGSAASGFRLELSVSSTSRARM